VIKAEDVVGVAQNMRDRRRDAELAAVEYAHQSGFSQHQIGMAKAYEIAEDELFELVKHYTGTRIA